MNTMAIDFVKYVEKFDGSKNYDSIISTPPSHSMRGISYGVCGIFIISLLFSCLFSVDVSVSSRGRVIPQSHVKIVQPATSGIVKAILVKNGDFVKKGDIIMELDPFLDDVNVKGQREAWEKLNLTQIRLDALLNNVDPLWPEGVSSEIIQEHRNILREETLFLSSNIQMIDSKISTKRQELERVKFNVEHLKTTLSALKQLYENQQKLFEKRYTTKSNLFNAETAYKEAILSIKTFESNLKSIFLEIRALEGEKISFKSQTLSKHYEKLEGVKKLLDQLKNDNHKIFHIKDLKVIKAPIDGVVEDFKIHTIGSVVGEGSTLLKIVPQNKPLEVEAKVLNKDIAFLKVGQKVHVKFDAFPFGVYGDITGTLTKISQDAISADTGSFYQIYVSLDHNYFPINGKNINITPGMDVTADVLTTKRRIISYITAPIIEHTRKSLREI